MQPLPPPHSATENLARAASPFPRLPHPRCRVASRLLLRRRGGWGGRGHGARGAGRRLLLGRGGFLGLGQKNVAVSWDRIEWTPREDGEVELSMPFTREELEQAPEFKDLETQRAEEEAAAAQQPPAGTPGAMAPTPAAPPAQQ